MRFILLAAAMWMLVACSTLKTDDPDKEVRAFLTRFQNDLSVASTDSLLKYFRVNQSPEALALAVRVLQNQDSYIECNFQFNSAGLVRENDRVKVYLPTIFKVRGSTSEDSVSHILTFWLSLERDHYKITEFDGEPFYQQFSVMKHRAEWQAEQEAAYLDRRPIYERAAELEKKYDSVVWFAKKAGQQPYFYVTTGKWKDARHNISRVGDSTALMGLVDWDGNIVIPVEYDMVGAISFLPANMVEVTKAGKVGYFDLKRKVLVAEPLYDMIVPYTNQYIVKKGSEYGFLDVAFMYHAGFPSPAAEKWMKDCKFLSEPIRLAAGSQAFCEIPAEDYAGSGILPMPSYLKRFGIFNSFEENISTTSVPLHGWTEYRESNGSWLQDLGNTFTAIVTTFRERYLEGRDEFYDNSRVILTNANLDVLFIKQLEYKMISTRLIDSLVEIRGQSNYDYMGEETDTEINLPSYSYFRLLSPDSIVELESNRRFSHTQFVRIDSSYLSGDFKIWISETEEQVSTTFLSIPTITFMRDEILADNGYQFPEDSGTLGQFVYDKWYTPKYLDLQECVSSMTPVDRHNYDFLNRVLERMKPHAM